MNLGLKKTWQGDHFCKGLACHYLQAAQVDRDSRQCFRLGFADQLQKILDATPSSRRNPAVRKPATGDSAGSGLTELPLSMNMVSDRKPLQNHVPLQWTSVSFHGFLCEGQPLGELPGVEDQCVCLGGPYCPHGGNPFEVRFAHCLPVFCFSGFRPFPTTQNVRVVFRWTALPGSACSFRRPCLLSWSPFRELASRSGELHRRRAVL